MMEKEKTCAIAAARAAGDIIRALYATDSTVAYKGKDNPVTVADREANHKIHAILQGEFPDYGWLSEETTDSPARLSRRRVWVVYPIDGTILFIQKTPESAVSPSPVEYRAPLQRCHSNPI